jgi:hypothetical protein
MLKNEKAETGELENSTLLFFVIEVILCGFVILRTILLHELSLTGEKFVDLDKKPSNHFENRDHD